MDYNATSPTHQQSFVLPDEAATHRAAATLARILRPGDCVLLEGDLGAGKTTFVRGLLQSLTQTPLTVPSPTFTLVQSYDLPAVDTAVVTFHHYDLYRLPDANTEQDLTEIGFFDALNTGIALVEWPVRLGDHRPADVLTVRLTTLKDDTTRFISWSGTGTWATRAAQLDLAA